MLPGHKEHPTLGTGLSVRPQEPKLLETAARSLQPKLQTRDLEVAGKVMLLAGLARREGTGGPRSRVRARRYTLEPCLQREQENAMPSRVSPLPPACGPYLSQPTRRLVLFPPSLPSSVWRCGYCLHQPAHSGGSAQEKVVLGTLPWDLERPDMPKTTPSSPHGPMAPWLSCLG